MEKTCLFWKDSWKSKPLSSTLPEFFSFAKNKSILVAKTIEQGQLTTLFHLPLSEVAYMGSCKIFRLSSSL